MIKSRSIPDVCCSMVQRYEKYFFMYHICTIFSAKHASGSHGSFNLRHKMAFFVYAIFWGKDRFFVKEEYFTPKVKEMDEVKKTAMDYILSEISRPFPVLKSLCKDFCSYEEEKIFGYFNDAPHVRFPLIKDRGGYFCTIPNYIPSALLDGLYYRLDIPNSGDPDVNKEFSENMENYLGLIFEHFLKRSNVKYQQEITYDAGKRKNYSMAYST